MSAHQDLEKLAERHRDSHERAIVAAMYDAAFPTSATIDSFSVWQLVAKGAIASFLIANSESMVEILSRPGFLVCSGILVTSAIFGIYSKTQALRLRIATEVNAAIMEAMDKVYASFEEKEEELLALSKEVGHEIDTEVRFERVIPMFLAPLPWWSKWIAGRSIKKLNSAVHPTHVGRLKSLHSQGVGAFTQTVLFLTFFGAALVFAGASI
jgi:hypothetical protein